MKKKTQNTKHKSTSTLERRCLPAGDLRAAKNAKGGDMIAGYAAKFIPALSSNLGGFREELDPHCFDACLASNPDVRGLWNHDTTSGVLGRTTAGTLRLSVDKVGLRYEIDPPATSLARDLMISIDRKDVDQSSFGFTCLDDSWREDGSGGYIRTVLKANLFDVSPVVFAAYPDATVGTRGAALRNAPADVRAKLTRKDVIDAIIDGDDDADGDDPSDDDTNCGCDCDECEDDDCENCSNPDCEDERCELCAMQTRAAHLDLIARRLR